MCAWNIGACAEGLLLAKGHKHAASVGTSHQRSSLPGGGEWPTDPEALRALYGFPSMNCWACTCQAADLALRNRNSSVRSLAMKQQPRSVAVPPPHASMGSACKLAGTDSCGQGACKMLCLQRLLALPLQAVSMQTRQTSVVLKQGPCPSASRLTKAPKKV